MDARQEFFEEYARQHSFDPHDAEQWYLQPIEKIIATKVSSSFIPLFLFWSSLASINNILSGCKASACLLQQFVGHCFA